MTNPDFDSLLALTLDKHESQITDNVFKATPLADWLMRKDHVVTRDGGASIILPLEYGENETFGSYAGYDRLDTTPQEELTAARYEWALVSGSVVVSGEESEVKNNGPSAVKDLVKAKVRNLEKSYTAGLNRMWYSDGTGNNGKDFLGLAALIGNQSSTITVVGGIDATTTPWWRSVVSDANNNARTTRRWTTAFYDASDGMDRPTFGLTTQELFEDYEAELAPQLRFMSNEKADARFLNLEFKGIRIYFDDECPSGTTFFLNPDYLYLIKHSSRWMKRTPWKEAIDRDARYMQVLSAGQLAISNRQRQAVVIGQTVS